MGKLGGRDLTKCVASVALSNYLIVPKYNHTKKLSDLFVIISYFYEKLLCFLHLFAFLLWTGGHYN